MILDKNYTELDQTFKRLLASNGELFKQLIQFTDYEIDFIEHIISLRDSENEWEEDGIWHDDGSRVLAFTLSLTTGPIEGGILEFRKKDQIQSQKIHTHPYGTVIVFKTGIMGYEHKINAVTKGKRLIIAGWLYQKEDFKNEK